MEVGDGGCAERVESAVEDVFPVGQGGGRRFCRGRNRGGWGGVVVAAEGEVVEVGAFVGGNEARLLLRVLWAHVECGIKVSAVGEGFGAGGRDAAFAIVARGMRGLVGDDGGDGGAAGVVVFEF